MAYGERILGIAHGGCIPKFIHKGSPEPSLIIGHGQAFHPESWMAMAHGNLGRGIDSGGHIPAGNHEITRTNRATPVTSSYPVQACRMAELDIMVEMRPG